MKYLRLFENETAYNAAKNNLDLPNVSTIKNKPNWCAFKKVMSEIFYTSSNGNIVTPYSTTGFGANIVSNTYTNGVGRILFDSNVTSIGGSAFRGCSSLTSITIPEGVTSIGYYAFSDCSSLTSITIPEGVTSIGERAFQWCTSLTSVTIPNSVTSIGNSAFYACAITGITIPDSVTSIGDSAFYWCENLTSVTISDGVTSIGNSAFYRCFSLTNVYCKPITPPTLGSGAFYSNASSRKIYVPMASVDAYKAATNWSDYASAIEGYNF